MLLYKPRFQSFGSASSDISNGLRTFFLYGSQFNMDGLFFKDKGGTLGPQQLGKLFLFLSRPIWLHMRLAISKAISVRCYNICPIQRSISLTGLTVSIYVCVLVAIGCLRPLKILPEEEP